MLASVKLADLSQPVAAAAQVAARNSVTPVFTGMLLRAAEGRLRVQATDLTRDALREALQCVALAVGEAPPFSGVLCEAEGGGEIIFLATDTHRLAFVTGPELEGASFRALFPLKALEAAAAGKDQLLEFRVAAQAASVKGESVAVFTRLVSTPFPAWRSILPRSFEARVSVDAKDFAAVLERALLVARHADKTRANVVRLEFGPEGLAVKAEGEFGTFSEALEAEVEGEGRVYFNAAYLLDAARPLSGGRAVLEFGPEFKSLMLRGEPDARFSCLILPVLVREAAAA
jgi:DNA polymerase-3 subunit beta